MLTIQLYIGRFQIENDTIVVNTPRDAEGNPIPDEDVNNKMFVVVRNTKSAQNNLVSIQYHSINSFYFFTVGLQTWSR